MIPKQDRVKPRTVEDLDRKYNLQKVSREYAEIIKKNDSLEMRVSAISNEVNAKLKLSIFVDENGVVQSGIEGTADVIQFNSNNIIINSDNFKLTKEGEVTATAGYIGSFKIEGNAIVGHDDAVFRSVGENGAITQLSSAVITTRALYDGYAVAQATLTGVEYDIAMEEYEGGHIYNATFGYVSGGSTPAFGIDTTGAVLIRGDNGISLGTWGNENKGLMLFGNIIINGEHTLSGWVKYLSNTGNTRYMRFVNGLLVEETDDEPAATETMIN